MAVKGKTPQPLPVDSALSAHMGADNDPVYGRINQVAKARNMTEAQRKKAESDARRNRVMFDIPKQLEGVIDVLAAKCNVPRSQVASYLMILGLQALADGSGPAMEEALGLSKSMRYEHVLDLPEIPEKYERMVERAIFGEKR